MPICGLCLNEVAALVDSHIIPKSFTRELMGKKRAPLASINLQNPSPGRSAVSKNFGGIYDQIVCFDCERHHFQSADDYMVQFRRRLLSNRTKHKVHANGGQPSLRLRQHVADTDLVHRFAMQTLFRAHLAKRREFNQVELGAAAQQVRELILSSRSTLESGWQVALRLVKADLATVILSPMRAETDPPIYTFTLPNITFYIAATERGLIRGFSDIFLNSGEFVTIWHAKRLGDDEFLAISNWVAPWISDMEKIVRPRRAGFNPPSFSRDKRGRRVDETGVGETAKQGSESTFIWPAEVRQRFRLAAGNFLCWHKESYQRKCPFPDQR